MTLIFKQLQRFTCFLETVGREDVEKDKLQKFWVFTLLLIVFSVYEGRSLEFKLLPYHLSCCWDENCNNSNIIIYFTKMPKIHEQKINKQNDKQKNNKKCKLLVWLYPRCHCTWMNFGEGLDPMVSHGVVVFWSLSGSRHLPESRPGNVMAEREHSSSSDAHPLISSAKNSPFEILLHIACPFIYK